MNFFDPDTTYFYVSLLVIGTLIQFYITGTFVFDVVTLNVTSLIKNHWYASTPFIIIIVTNLQILFKSIIYNYLLTDYTKILYKNFFDKVKTQTQNQKTVNILDVGIGTGYALHKCLKELNQDDNYIDFLKRINYTGIDIDDKYLHSCSEALKHMEVKLFNVNLMDGEDRCKKLINITDGKHHEPITNMKFDYIFFSDSFAVIPPSGLFDRYDLLEYCRTNLLSENGRVIIVTTLDKDYSSIKSFIKQNIKLITQVDFGYYTTINDFLNGIQRRCDDAITIEEKNFSTMTNDELSAYIKNNVVSKIGKLEELQLIHSKYIPMYGDTSNYLCSLKAPHKNVS